MEWIALGAAPVEADTSNEAAEIAQHSEDTQWQVRYIVTAKEWYATSSAAGSRPWFGRAAVVGVPILGFGLVTGQNALWALGSWLGFIGS